MLCTGKVHSTDVKKGRRSVKSKMKVYKTDALTSFDCKCSSINWIWSPYCPWKGSIWERFGVLSWLMTLKVHQKLNFRINDHLEFFIIVCVRNSYQKLLANKNHCLYEYKSSSIDGLHRPFIHLCNSNFLIEMF